MGGGVKERGSVGWIENIKCLQKDTVKDLWRGLSKGRHGRRIWSWSWSEEYRHQDQGGSGLDGGHKQSLGIFLDEPWRRMAREGSDIRRALRGLSLKPQSPACFWPSSQMLWHLCDRGSLLKHALGTTHGTVLEGSSMLGACPEGLAHSLFLLYLSIFCSPVKRSYSSTKCFIGNEMGN